MEIRKTYVFKKDGATGFACGYKPKEGEIIEEREILYADEGKELYKGEELIGGVVWLKDTKKADYTEKDIVIEEEQAEVEEEQ